MKTLKITNLIVLLLSLIVVVSCVQDDDFDTPDLTIIEPELDGPVITLDALAGDYEQAFLSLIDDLELDPNNPNDADAIAAARQNFVFELTENLNHVSAYVVSDDEAGNFFEELILQDKAENPTIGIKLLIDVNPLYTRYEFGRKIYIKLGGLTIGQTNGVLTLGVLGGTRIEKIASADELKVINRSAELGTIVPLPTSIDMFDDSLTNLYIQLNDVQFNRGEVLRENPATFASEPSDEFDGERVLESCQSSASVILSTSTFADFKSLELPAQRGSMNGILTKNFFGDMFNVSVNSPNDITFDNPERCDPIEIDCGLATAQGDMTLFEDDFEGQTAFSPISGNGWTNYIEEGTSTWEAFTATGTNASLGVSARISAFGSGDDSSIAWLITPAINLDAQNNETLVFKTSNSFSDESDYELLFSNDWDGTEASITSANWGVLPAARVVTDEDFFGDWIDSGVVDLSCGEGIIYIAFRYIGNDIGGTSGDNNGTLELDDFSIDFSN